MSGGVPKYPWWLIEPISWVNGVIEMRGKRPTWDQLDSRIKHEWICSTGKPRIRVKVPGVSDSTQKDVAA